MPLRYQDDSAYAGGMIRDVPSWELGKGELYDALNLLFDKPGVARQRSGPTAIFSGLQTAFCSAIGWAYSTDVATIEELHGITIGANMVTINKTGGAPTVIYAFGAGAQYLGRPTQHFGFCIFPYHATGDTRRFSHGVAGATTNLTFTNTAVANVVANGSEITLTGADVTTNVKVGQIVYFGNATNQFLGRVTAITAAKTFTVWPTPTFAAALVAGALKTGPVMDSFSVFTAIGGRCMTSFQNRLLAGNVHDWFANVPEPVFDRRINYSLLPTENWVDPGPLTTEGALFLANDFYPTRNFVQIPGADPIIGMEPSTDNELLVLTPTRPVLLRGNLITQLSTTATTVTFDIADLDTTGGCGSDFSIVRTPRGIMWAGTDGIFVYPGGGSRPVNVLEGRNATYWRDLARSPTFQIHGAAYLRGHYFLGGASPSGTPWALMLNLATREPTFTRLSNVDIFNAAQRPSLPAQVWAGRWWDNSGAAPNMTNGMILRLESMLDPYAAGSTRTDHDGAVIPFSLTSRATPPRCRPRT
jgi:hypothetical protein